MNSSEKLKGFSVPGQGIAREVQRLFPHPGTLILYLGSGNNGGDALVAGRELQRQGWKVLARLSCPPEKLKPLPHEHLDAMADLTLLEATPYLPSLPRPLVQMPRYVAFAKGDKVRAERFAEALERVRASGALDKILQQWEQ